MSAALLERLRAARLHRQRAAHDLDDLIARSVGLHSTDYASPYLSAWARVPDFDPGVLFGRLSRGEGLVRVNAFRNTVHVVRVDDLPLVLAACGPSVAATGRRGLGALSDRDLDAGVDALCEALADGPLQNAAIKAARPALAPQLHVALGPSERDAIAAAVVSLDRFLTERFRPICR